MKFNELNLSAKKSAKRVGRGISAGQGKTAGRGTKGQGSRKSGGVRPGFEGGQTPLYMRLPKLRGFRSVRPKVATVKTSQLAAIKGDITAETLHSAALIGSPYSHVKLVFDAEVTSKLSVKLTGASEKAVASIEKAGGSFEKVARIQRVAKKSSEESSSK